MISASGGNIDDFRLSRTTGYRSREKVEKVVAANAKSEFQNLPGQVQEIGSDKVTIGEKRSIAKALIAVKDDFDIRKVDTDHTKFDVMKIWPETSYRPSLSKFVTKDSWLMFHLLDLLYAL